MILQILLNNYRANRYIDSFEYQIKGSLLDGSDSILYPFGEDEQ